MSAMRILVTGGAGFIGSHTASRLLAEGHAVTIVDSLRAPVHQDGRAAHLPEGATFHQGDVRDRELMTRLIKDSEAIYHFAAYQDYLADFSTFFDINVTSTALIYEILVAEGLRPKRVVIASSQAVMGEGLYLCPDRGYRTPDIRLESQLREGRWDIECADCNEHLQVQASSESIANPQNPYAISKFGQEMIGLTLGRRYDIPTVLLRYSIVQGPRQSVYNAYSGACRIFCLSYKTGIAPVIYEDGKSLRDYVNIDDVVDANLLVLDHVDAPGCKFNVGGGKAYTVLDFADFVRRHYGSNLEPNVTGEYRYGDTRHIFSDICALQSLGWSPTRGPDQSVAAYAAWLENMDGLEGILDEALAKMRGSGVVRSVQS